MSWRIFWCHATKRYTPSASITTTPNGKIMVLDFEQVMLDRSADDNAFFTMTGIRHLAQLYREMRVWYRHEGLLEAA
jgi:hypothetical protein